MYRIQIDKIKSGNLEELDKIYLEVKPKFFSYATNNFKQISIEEIEDIYQDTIIVFYQNIIRGLLTDINSSLSAYVIQIGKMKLIKHTESVSKQIVMLSYHAENAIQLDEYDNRVDEVVKFIFSTMSDGCKQILNLFYFNKKSMDEIALLLGYKNADTVKSKKSRCLSNISESVSKMYHNNE